MTATPASQAPADPATDEPPYPATPTPAADARRRRWRWGLAIAAFAVFAGLAAFVLVVFQPHKLFIDDRVDEALPGLVVTQELPAAAGPAPVVPDAPVEPAPPVSDDPFELALLEARRTGVPVAVTTGSFISVDHPTSGTALLVVQPDGSRLLRIEDLDTDNGPDLRVVLSTGESGGGDYDELVELGRLKGNIGSQNYEIPADLDLSGIRSVVIWCERFSVSFGEAPLVV